MSLTASQRALLYLYEDAGHRGVSCYDVGSAVWPDRAIRKGRGVSVNGGGDYAAQMLLGRLKKAGLVEYAPSKGSTRWRLTAKGIHEIQRGDIAEHPAPAARVPSTLLPCTLLPCVCGCAIEEHGHDAEYPGSTSCTACGDCIAYEADPSSQAAPSRPLAAPASTPAKTTRRRA